MANIDLRYWIGTNVLALEGGFYYPAIIQEANNTLACVFAEFKSKKGFILRYDDVINTGLYSIMSDVSPPFVDIVINVKVAVRVSPYGIFAPGFVCDLLPECGRILVRLYSSQEFIVGPEDIRLIIPPWCHYSMYYLQRNISYNKADIAVHQPQFSSLPNQYYQQETFQPVQEILPSMSTFLEASKQLFPTFNASANNFSGCHVMEKESIVTEPSKYSNINNSDVDSQYQNFILDAERVNQCQKELALYEKHSSYNNYSDVKHYGTSDIVTATQAECGCKCEDQNLNHAISRPALVKNVKTSESDYINSSCAPRMKRKYTKRKNVSPMSPKKSSKTSLEQVDLKKTRKPNAFFIFCKEYRNSVFGNPSDKQSVKHVSQKLAEIWSSLPLEQKKKYQDKAEELKRDQLIKAEWDRWFNPCNENYDEINRLPINSYYTPGYDTKGDMITSDAPNSCSDDEPQLVIDESKFGEYSEDDRSPLFIPRENM